MYEKKKLFLFSSKRFRHTHLTADPLAKKILYVYVTVLIKIQDNLKSFSILIRPVTNEVGQDLSAYPDKKC